MFQHLWEFTNTWFHWRNFIIGTVVPILSILCVCVSLEMLNKWAAWMRSPLKVMEDRCADLESEMCPLPGGQVHADPRKGLLLVSQAVDGPQSCTHPSLPVQPLVEAD